MDKELLDKLKNIIISLFEDKKNEKIDINIDESILFSDLINIFSYISLYPMDKKLKSSKYIEKAVKEGNFFRELYVKGTEDYNKILQECKFVDNKFIKHTNIDNYHYSIDYIYEKEDDFIKLFFKTNVNENIYFKSRSHQTKNEIKNLKIPMICNAEVREKLLNSKYLLGKEKNEVAISYLAFLTNKNDFKLAKSLASGYVIYVDLGDYLVEKENYENGSFKDFKDIQENLTRCVVLNNSAEILPAKNYNAEVILHALRTSISHFPIFKYELESVSGMHIDGRIFITNENDRNNDNDRFKRAIIMDNVILSALNDIALIDDVSSKKQFSYAFIPFNYNKIENNADLQQIIENCKLIKFEFIEEVNVEIANILIKDILQKYQKTPNIKEIKTKLETYLSERLCGVEVIVQDFKNQNFILNLLQNKVQFFSTKLQKEHILEKYLNFIINNFYGTKIIEDEKFIRKLGDTKIIRPQVGGLLYVNQNVKKIIKLICEKSYSSNNINNLFGREYYIWLCWFTAFSTLVYNRFVENLKLGNNSLLQQLQKEDMSNFTLGYPDENGVWIEEKVIKLEDKENAIKAIRNAITHYLFNIELNGNNDFKKDQIVFYLPPEKEDGLKPVIKISAENFLEFVSREIFANFKENIETKICVSNFDELIQKTKEILLSIEVTNN